MSAFCHRRSCSEPPWTLLCLYFSIEPLELAYQLHNKNSYWHFYLTCITLIFMLVYEMAEASI